MGIGMMSGAATVATVEESKAVINPAAPRILIAASGTGGHLIPAVHIAAAIRERSPEAVIEFIGAGRPLEEKVVVGRGYTRHIVAAAGVKRRGITGLLQFLMSLPRGFSQLRRLYTHFRPDVVVGVGGYVSVLPVIVARMRGIPTWTHEAELHPGLANRVLAHFADWMSVPSPDTVVGGRVKIEVTGHPVRPELRGVDRNRIPEGGAPQHLLVLGGSQGARGLDEAVKEIAPLLVERQMEVVHQCREEHMEQVAREYAAAKIPAHVVAFIEDMPGAYEWSDVIISRAGASSVAEISCVNRPAIFVPYPFQQGTHQTDNARTLVDRSKAVIVEENRPEFGRRLREALLSLSSPDRFKAMKDASFEPKGLNAAESIAKGILSLVRR